MLTCHLWSGRTLGLPSYTKERTNGVVLPMASLFQNFFFTQPVHKLIMYILLSFAFDWIKSPSLVRVIVRSICHYS
jgi:hypothetical protein